MKFMQISKVSTKKWVGLSNVRKKLFTEYLTKFHEKVEIKNRHLGITVKFIRDGGKKIAYGGNLYAKKAAIIEILESVIENAVYNNFGERKENDKYSVIGYLNFKAKVLIDSRLEHLHLVIQMRMEGYFYYTHEVNKKRN